MKYIGAHVSIEGGIFNAPTNATKIGAKAFALFTKNQRQWKSAPYSVEDIQKFKVALDKASIEPQYVLPHSSYLINIGHPGPAARKQSVMALIDEVQRCEQLGLTQLNFHPGYHLCLTSEIKCLNLIAESINEIFAVTSKVSLLIENTAGQGSALGYRFEHLAEIIAKVCNKKRIGVCIDTCHLFASGYDIRDADSYQQTWEAFSKIVGFQYLRAMHLNDSKSTLGSKIDRHASLGIGNIGINAFSLLMQDVRMDDMPLILETDNKEIWPQEIQLLYNLSAGKNCTNGFRESKE